MTLAMNSTIDFDGINAAALRSARALLPDLPVRSSLNGRRQ
jgi:hypothetical protein